MPQPDKRPSAWAGMASGAAVFLVAFVAALKPAPVVSVSEWAEEARYVAPESGSPFPGKWHNDLVPYMVEIMDCMSFDHPCTSVTLAKSHQIAGTEGGVNLFGYVVDRHPSPVAIVLPTIDEAKKYDRVKLAPTIQATPALSSRVREQKSRDDKGSTVFFKRFRGGFCTLTGANSSVGLQMISARVLIAEEISEWPSDAGNRGDPLAQAEKRLTAWELRGVKKYYGSTPAVKGACRISDKYEASDQRRLYVPCPHCSVYQVLAFDNLKWRSDAWPHGAYFVCAAHGCVIEHFEKRDMVARGVWIKTYPAEGDEPDAVIEAAEIERWRGRDGRGRQPGFHIWQAYSPFASWDTIVNDWLDAEGNPLKEKVCTQQIRGEPYEETGDAPDWEKLFLRREAYPLGRIPPGGLKLTGMSDVQVNRIEWAVYAWGIGMTAWLVDKGIVEGDPARWETWREFAPIIERKYEDWQGKLWEIDAFGVDSGYLSNLVYQFSRTRKTVFALDGRGGSEKPPIGTPSDVDVTFQGRKIKGGARLWPTGTHGLKSTIYACLNKTVEGPDQNGAWPMGCWHFPDACDQEFFKQLTAEYITEKEKAGKIELVWRKAAGQANEQLDIAVGARALAWHLGLDNYTADKWRALAAERDAPPEQVQQDLLTYWSPGARTRQPGLSEHARDRLRRLGEMNR